MTTAAVVGVGAIGTFFATHLALGGRAAVTACVRTPLSELVVDSTDGTVRATVAVATDPAAVEPVDWVLLATKAHQTDGAGPWLQALCHDGTTVVVLQNGVEHEARVRPWVGTATVVPAVVYCGAEVVEPGHIVHRSSGFMVVPDEPPGRALAELFADARASVRTTDDFTTAAWQKLAGNTAVNGITALTGQRMSVVRRDDVAAVCRQIVEETVAVAEAEGAHIDPAYTDVLLGTVAAMSDDMGTSMLYDRLAGRPLEHDAIYGAVVRAGRRHGVPTPTIDVVLALLAGLNDGFGD